MPALSAEAEADKKIPCTLERARPVTFAEVHADPRKWEAWCVRSPLGQAPEPRERSANWDARVSTTEGAAASPPRPSAVEAAPFLATVKRPVVTISLLSAGRLDIVDGCVTAALRGKSYTAVFPPGARLVRDGATWSAVRYEGRSLAMGSNVGLPGGGARLPRGILARPIPARCPKEVFVIGG